MDEKKSSAGGKKNNPNMIENLRRTLLGMPSSDPNNGTTWKDTLLFMIILIVLLVPFRSL
ncbi:hypothetical protein BAU15_07460 [Enterococcus sp. JM4C]|uniref:hypothetical protein n=1 Tax=Candidatus Enterococcus huntleyi TaxID=1857217 RepID=UPI00137B36E6|nr:hypothetical protein [Enterococcus sp. JM4C]KAF1297541.1 hypothetical protein BAU15_07460 [Enterococcus sp. JM4C]